MLWIRHRACGHDMQYTGQAEDWICEMAAERREAFMIGPCPICRILQDIAEMAQYWRDPIQDFREAVQRFAALCRQLDPQPVELNAVEIHALSTIRGQAIKSEWECC